MATDSWARAALVAAIAGGAAGAVLAIYKSTSTSKVRTNKDLVRMLYQGVWGELSPETAAANAAVIVSPQHILVDPR